MFTYEFLMAYMTWLFSEYSLSPYLRAAYAPCSISQKNDERGFDNNPSYPHPLVPPNLPLLKLKTTFTYKTPLLAVNNK